MKAMRKAAAQIDRQNTTVQLSPASMKRAIAPPKLQTIADRQTSTKPMRSSRDGTDRRSRRRRLSLRRLTHVACGREQAPCRRNSRGSQSARTIQSRSVWRGPAAQSGCGNRAAACRSPASPAAGEPWPDGAQQPPCGAISVICAAVELVVASRPLFAAREFADRPSTKSTSVPWHAISRLKFDN